MAKRKLERGKKHQIYRTSKGEIVPGCSGVSKIGESSDALLYWAWDQGRNGKDYRETSKTACDIGSLSHFLTDCHLAGDEPDLSDYAQVDIDKAETAFIHWLDWWKEQKLTVVGIEVQLTSDTYRVGGTIDLVAVNEHGDHGILDWKSSKAVYMGAKTQLAGGYELIWNDKNPDKICKWRTVVHIPKTESGKFTPHPIPSEHVPTYQTLFKHQLEVYRAMKVAQKLK